MPTETATCYRHPDREAPLRCTRCDRPICLDDAIDAPVGFLCPEDAQQSARVRRVQRDAGAPVTRVLVGLLVGVFLLQEFGPATVTRAGLLTGSDVAAGEWYRLVSSAFLHGGLLHIAFNGYLLWQLGQMLEPSLGRLRYLGIYAAGLAGGSAGVMLLSWRAGTLGASGAVFGLMGAAMVLLHRRGIDPWQTSIGSLVLLNLVLTFVIPGISVGGHVGGLVGGALAAAVLRVERRGAAATAAPWALAAVFMAIAWWAGVAGPVLPRIPLIG